MITFTIQVINRLGLHARASAKFVATCCKFQSAISVTNGSQIVNGKSIMGVMMLAAHQGSELTIEIQGPDEADMQTALTLLIQNRFGEAE